MDLQTVDLRQPWSADVVAAVTSATGNQRLQVIDILKSQGMIVFEGRSAQNIQKIEDAVSFLSQSQTFWSGLVSDLQNGMAVQNYEGTAISQGLKFVDTTLGGEVNSMGRFNPLEPRTVKLDVQTIETQQIIVLANDSIDLLDPSNPNFESQAAQKYAWADATLAFVVAHEYSGHRIAGEMHVTQAADGSRVKPVFIDASDVVANQVMFEAHLESGTAASYQPRVAYGSVNRPGPAETEWGQFKSVQIQNWRLFLDAIRNEIRGHHT